MDIKQLTRKEVLNLDSVEYAPKKEVEHKIADLSLNINPYGVSKKVLTKLNNLDPNKISHYYPENQELIEEIASYLNITKENVMIGDGCDGCLHMIANTFIEEGDEVIIPTPTFHRYEFHTKLVGGKPIFIPMENFELSAKDVLAKITKRTKIIFLCNPNNPTGRIINQKVKEEIIKNFGGLVVVDEALADATDINGPSLLKKYDNLVVVRSFSKTFGLASLRIGYIISNPLIIEEIKKTSSPFQVNGVAQELALEALKDKEHILKSREYINKNRERLISSLEKLGLKCSESVTTNFLVDISPISSDSTEFVNKLKDKGIYVTDAKVFRLPSNKYIRVSVASEKENEIFIKEIEKLVKGA